MLEQGQRRPREYGDNSSDSSGGGGGWVMGVEAEGIVVQDG